MLDIWCCFQSLHYKSIRIFVNSPYFVFNNTLYKDLNIFFVRDFSISSLRSFYPSFFTDVCMKGRIDTVYQENRRNRSTVRSPSHSPKAYRDAVDQIDGEADASNGLNFVEIKCSLLPPYSIPRGPYSFWWVVCLWEFKRSSRRKLFRWSLSIFPICSCLNNEFEENVKEN